MWALLYANIRTQSILTPPTVFSEPLGCIELTSGFLSLPGLHVRCVSPLVLNVYMYIHEMRSLKFNESERFDEHSWGWGILSLSTFQVNCLGKYINLLAGLCVAVRCFFKS